MGLFKVGAACSPDITDTHATLLAIVKIISADDESRINAHTHGRLQHFPS